MHAIRPRLAIVQLATDGTRFDVHTLPEQRGFPLVRLRCLVPFRHRNETMDKRGNVTPLSDARGVQVNEEIYALEPHALSLLALNWVERVE